MSYSKEYIFENISKQLPGIKIEEQKIDKENSVYLLDYNGHKGKIDVNSFINKFNKDNETTKKKIDEFIYYIVENLKSQEDLHVDKIENIKNKIFPILRATGFNKV